MGDLDSIVSVSITTLTSNVSRAGFGVPLLAAYVPTSVQPERVKEYSSLSAMTTDGILVTDMAYKMAEALKAQSPSVTTWKIGRLALPGTWKTQLTPLITTEGEVISLTVAGQTVSYTIPAAASVASIATALTALIDAIGGVTATDLGSVVEVKADRWKSVTLTVDTPDNSQTFHLFVNGTEFIYTSDGTATVTEIRDGLKALVDADPTISALVATANNGTDAIDFTEIGHTEGFYMTESAGGSGAMSFSSAVNKEDRRVHLADWNPKHIKYEDKHVDPGIATDLSAIETEDNEWYGLVISAQAQNQIIAAAAWAESRTILFGAGTCDIGYGSTNVADQLNNSGYDRTYIIKSLDNQEYLEARWMGKIFPTDPGSSTWSYKTLSGGTIWNADTADLAAADADKLNHYTRLAGVSITRYGYASSGKYLDLTRGVDWFQARLQERIYGLLVSSAKLPFTDVTGDAIRAQILAQLTEGQNNGLIAPDTEATPWVVTIPLASAVSAIDKSNRVWPDIEFSATLAGAVHTFTLQGTLAI